MGVLLLNPKRRQGISYTIIPNVGLGYIAKVLRKKGTDVSVTDANRDALGPEQFGDIVAAKKPAWVGITVFSPFLTSSAQYAQAAKDACPDTKIVLGGPHPTFEPEGTFRRIPQADFVVVSEGEPAVDLLTSHIENGTPEIAHIPNLAWRNGEKIVRNKTCLVEDLDELGAPDWDILEPNKFPLAPNGIFARAASAAPIIATRGCPYPCTFCGAGRSMGKRLRSRSPENIRNEMEMLNKKFGIGEIHFMDDNFTQDQKMVRRLCKAIIEKGPRIPWACPNGVRLDRIDKEMALLMEKAGCYSMAIGIEFGTDRMLEKIKKRLSVEKISEKVKMLKENTAMRLTGFFILGHPDETEQDIKKTVAFSLALPLDRANYFNFTPFPGSELYDDLKASGALATIDYEKMYIHSIAYNPPAVPEKKLILMQRNAHLKFYLRPRILWGLLKEIRGWTQVRVLLSRAWHLITGR